MNLHKFSISFSSFHWNSKLKTCSFACNIFPRFFLSRCPFAACHCVVGMMLDEHYPGRGGTIVWPQRSPDLTSLDFSLWSFAEGALYVEPYRKWMKAHRKISTELDCRRDNLFREEHTQNLKVYSIIWCLFLIPAFNKTSLVYFLN